MSLIGYARVSTRDQHPESQIDVLNAAGCDRVFVDKASGTLARRPELDKVLEYLRSGDSLVITKLDRLGRSVRNLIDLALDLDRRGVSLKVLHQGIDTSTPGGRLFFHIVASIAEFERDLISERTKDGLDAARARGRKGGRRPVLSEEQAAHLREQWNNGQGKTPTELARLFGIGRTTVYRVLGVSEPGPATASSATTAPSRQRR